MRVLSYHIDSSGVLTTIGDHEYSSDNSDAFSSLEGIQITESENHPGWNLPRQWGVFKGDLGGEFFTIKKSIESDTFRVKDMLSGKFTGWDSAEQVYYTGPLLPLGPRDLLYPPDLSSTGDTLDEWGASAIARISPSNPSVDLTTFVGELVHDGIPKLTGSLLKGWRQMSKKQRRKAIAEEHLNYQFGWKPFVADMRDISKRIINGNAAITQYERDSGKSVRRRYSSPPEEWTFSKYVARDVRPWTSPSSSTMYDWNVSPAGDVIAVTKVTQMKWFSGAFSWYIPKRGNSLRDDMARQVIMAKKSLGIRFTPDAIWNLAPWSWAIDWFSNAGDVIQNISNWIIDGQVLTYGYVMEHTTATTTYTFVGPTGLQSTPVRPLSFTLKTEVKVRRKATPYGFGITWEGLTARQLSILAALGITHGSK